MRSDSAAGVLCAGPPAAARWAVALAARGRVRPARRVLDARDVLDAGHVVRDARHGRDARHLAAARRTRLCALTGAQLIRQVTDGVLELGHTDFQRLGIAALLVSHQPSPSGTQTARKL